MRFIPWERQSLVGLVWKATVKKAVEDDTYSNGYGGRAIYAAIGFRGAIVKIKNLQRHTVLQQQTTSLDQRNQRTKVTPGQREFESGTFSVHPQASD